MKPISDARLEKLEAYALDDCIADLKAFRTYQGDNPRYLQKAKLAAGIIGGFARIRASESNRMAVELQAQRQLAGDDVLQLSAGRG